MFGSTFALLARLEKFRNRLNALFPPVFLRDQSTQDVPI